MTGDLEEAIDHDVLVDELSTPPTQEEAAELALSARRMQRQTDRLIDNLTPKEREFLKKRFSGALKEDPQAANAAAERAIARIGARLKK